MSEIRLTPQQQMVVENRGGTLLVSAAAGSGKTKVLVDRVLRRIVEEGKNIHEFLIITFTEAAAAELKKKISSELSKTMARQPENKHLARQMTLLQFSQISTVHAFCGALIRQYGYLLEIPGDYRIVEGVERTELLDQQLEQLLDEAFATKSPGFLFLADTLGAGRTDKGLKILIQTLYEQVLTQPDPQKWMRQQNFFIPDHVDLAETPWGKVLAAHAKQQILYVIQQYQWAISMVEGDEALEKGCLPSFQEYLVRLGEMLHACDLPWDQIAPELIGNENRLSTNACKDKNKAEQIKAVKREGNERIKHLQTFFSRSSAELKAEQNALAPALEALLELINQLDQRFSAEKRRKNLLDFSDQEQIAINLLVHRETGAPTEVAREVSARFTEIMVDEYQDSNRIQETIFRAISSSGDANRFLVGDVKQSIYGFRQSEPELFLEKYRTYPWAEQAQTGEPRKLVLSRNFRSRPEILEAVNHVFAAVMSETVGDIVYGPEEQLYPGLEDYPSTEVPHVEFHVFEKPDNKDEQEEIKYQQEVCWVVRKIAKMLQDKVEIRGEAGLRPVRPEDIAILLRTRKPISIYKKALEQAGIPVAADMGDNLYQTPEVKVLVSLLRVLSNPHQDIPLIAVLCSPLFRFSNRQLAQIRAGSGKSRFYDAMLECAEPWCVDALSRLQKLRKQAGEESAEHLVWTLLHEQGLLAAYSALEGGESRRDNLMRVYQFAQKAAGGSFLYLHQLLRKLDQAAQSDAQASKKGSAAGVIITTIHKSKGLEYPVVFLTNLSKGFSDEDYSKNFLFDSALGITARITDFQRRVQYPGLCFLAAKVKKEAEIRSEELRILYVAMTRARDYLIMTFAPNKQSLSTAKLVPGATFPAAPWASNQAKCLGDWVRLAALSRIEAGELFAQFGRNAQDLVTSQYPWRICYEPLERLELPSKVWQTGESEPVSDVVPLPEEFLEQLNWKYAHLKSTVTPSKLTATQLKGRTKDSEAAEGAKVQISIPQLHRPDFVWGKQGLTPTERGTAVHLFLQYAAFESCLTEQGIKNEKCRLEDEAFMVPEQLEAVDPEPILRLFHAELGRRILSADHLIREFKFSILEDATAYYSDVEGESVLLQGVVDVAFEENGQWYVVDFKTDRVSEASLLQRAETYRGQMETYRRALERIFSKPVHGMYLYFLALGKEVAL